MIEGAANVSWANATSATGWGGQGIALAVPSVHRMPGSVGCGKGSAAGVPAKSIADVSVAGTSARLFFNQDVQGFSALVAHDLDGFGLVRICARCNDFLGLIGGPHFFVPPANATHGMCPICEAKQLEDIRKLFASGGVESSEIRTDSPRTEQRGHALVASRITQTFESEGSEWSSGCPSPSRSSDRPARNSSLLEVSCG